MSHSPRTFGNECCAYVPPFEAGIGLQTDSIAQSIPEARNAFADPKPKILLVKMRKKLQS